MRAVLLHGLGGSPLDVEPLVEPLNRRGFHTLSPALPGAGPGGAEEDLEPGQYIEWLRSLLQEEDRPAHLAAFSFGATLALAASADELVERMVLIAPFFALTLGEGVVRRTLPLLEFLVPAVPKPWSGRINDPEGARRYRPGTRFFPLRPLGALQELADGAAHRLGGLESLEAQVLFLRGDRVASPSRTEALLCARPGVECVVFERSNHVLLYDYDAAEAVDRAVRYLAGEEG